MARVYIGTNSDIHASENWAAFQAPKNGKPDEVLVLLQDGRRVLPEITLARDATAGFVLARYGNQWHSRELADASTWRVVQTYTLDGHTAIPEPDFNRYCTAKLEGRESGQHIVARDVIGDLEVSTVFLYDDMRFGHSGEPMLFETIIFGFPEFEAVSHATWEDAERVHKAICKTLRSLATTSPPDTSAPRSPASSPASPQ